MADIPHELREAATYGTAMYNRGYEEGLKAGKRAGMERAAEIATNIYCDGDWLDRDDAANAIAQAIRSENDA